MLQFTDPATGKPVVERIWTREEAFAGTRMASAPDLTLSLRDGGLVSILPSEVLLKARKETTGAHRPNGVFVTAGRGVRRGCSIPALSLLDISPLLLYMLGLPVPQDLEGKVPEMAFEPEYFRSNPVSFEASRSTSSIPATQFPEVDLRMDADVMSQLRALGYME